MQFGNLIGDSAGWLKRVDSGSSAGEGAASEEIESLRGGLASG